MFFWRLVDLVVSRRRRRRPSTVELCDSPELGALQSSSSSSVGSSLASSLTKRIVFPSPTPPAVRCWQPLIPNHVTIQPSARRRSRWLCPTAVSVGGVAAVLVVGGVVRWSVVAARRRRLGEAGRRSLRRIIGGRWHLREIEVGCARLFLRITYITFPGRRNPATHDHDGCDVDFDDDDGANDDD